MTEKILVVVHQPTSTPGRVGMALEDRGYTLDVRRPCLGHPLPESTEEYSGVVVFGGPMSANDCQELDFIRTELDWFDVPLREGTPFLGICLGCQMLARTLGAEVSPHPDGMAEIGYYPISVTEAGQKLMSNWPDHVYQWHKEGFSTPGGAEILVTTEMFGNQAFRYGQSAFGVQFHAELTLAMMHRWTTKGRERLKMPGTHPREAHFDGRRVHDPAVKVWLNSFLDLWLASDAREQALAAE